jgi:DNA-binding response OmpR family regulator
MHNIVSILIIEDDEMTANLYQRLLEDSGYNVLTAPDTFTAEQILGGIEVDLMLLDYALPDQIGVHWLSDLRGDSRFSSLPVILVSNIERDDDLSEDRYVWFMEKPRQPQHIVTAVEHIIEQFV